MNNKYSFVSLVAVAVIAAAVAVVGIKVIPSNLGGDFAGGVSPSSLFTANVSSNYITPVGSFSIAASNGAYVGGTNQYNLDSSFVSASGTPSAVATLNAFNTATGTTATTSITLSYVGNLAVGAICSGSTATTTVFVSGCLLNSTNGVTGTAIVAYSNLTGASLSVPTSTRLNITFDQLPY